MENIGKPKYGIIDSGLFGLRIVAGIVTGIRYTGSKPVYELSFAKDKWWTSELAETPEGIASKIKLASLEKIKETHGLQIKFGSKNE